jgi:hypothetical protein
MKSKWLFAGLIIISVTGLAAFKTIERRVIKKNLLRSKLVGEVYVVVDKSDYELQVFDAEGWYASIWQQRSF